MENSVPPQLATAFKIFIDEFSTHISVLERIASEPAPADFAKSRYAVEHRCHTLKGGALFLKLTDLGRAAERGEKAAHAAVSPEAFAALKADLPGLIAELKALFAAAQNGQA